MICKLYLLCKGVPTVCVIDVWAGVDSVWEQRKTRSQPVLVIVQGKMLAVGAADRANELQASIVRPA
jgi:hypothetical protein